MRREVEKEEEVEENLNSLKILLSSTLSKTRNRKLKILSTI